MLSKTLEAAKKAQQRANEYHQAMLAEIASGSLDRAKEYKAFRDDAIEEYDNLMAQMGF